MPSSASTPNATVIAIVVVVAMVVAVAIAATSPVSSGSSSSCSGPEAWPPRIRVLRLRSGIWRRRVVTARAPSTRTSPAVWSASRTVGVDGIPLGHAARRVDDPAEDTNKDDGEDQSAPINATAAVVEPTAVGDVGVSSLALASQSELVLDAAAALEDVGIVGVRVSFADDVGAAELELLGERRGAAPLDVLVAPGGSLVGAAHHVDLVQVADGAARDAAELGDGRYATVVRHGALAAEGKGLDVGELDGILGLTSGERQGREAKAESEQTGYHDGGGGYRYLGTTRCLEV